VKSKLSTVLMALALCMAAFIIAPVSSVFAGTQGSCSVSDTTKVRLYENRINDTSDGNDQLWLCGNDSNLTQTHTLSGGCQSQAIIKPFDDWNDCVSSAFVYVPASTILCFYENANYSGYAQKVTPRSERIDLIAGIHDKVSSLRFISGNPSTTGCF
jgi:hypothetical protein